MIAGARNRVSPADHWDLDRQGEEQHAALLADLVAAIRNYAAPLQEVNSTAAGAAILSSWSRRDEWSRTFGSRSSQLFGMVLWVTLFDDAATSQLLTCGFVELSPGLMFESKKPTGFRTRPLAVVRSPERQRPSWCESPAVIVADRKVG